MDTRVTLVLLSLASCYAAGIDKHDNKLTETRVLDHEGGKGLEGVKGLGLGLEGYKGLGYDHKLDKGIGLGYEGGKVLELAYERGLRRNEGKSYEEGKGYEGGYEGKGVYEENKRFEGLKGLGLRGLYEKGVLGYGKGIGYERGLNYGYEGDRIKGYGEERKEVEGKRVEGRGYGEGRRYGLYRDGYGEGNRYGRYRGGHGEGRRYYGGRGYGGGYGYDGGYGEKGGYGYGYGYDGGYGGYGEKGGYGYGDYGADGGIGGYGYGGYRGYGVGYEGDDVPRILGRFGLGYDRRTYFAEGLSAPLTAQELQVVGRGYYGRLYRFQNYDYERDLNNDRILKYD